MKKRYSIVKLIILAAITISPVLKADMVHRIELQYSTIDTGYYQDSDWTTDQALDAGTASFRLRYHSYIGNWNFKLGFEDIEDVYFRPGKNTEYFGSPFTNKLLIKDRVGSIHEPTTLPDRKISQQEASLSLGYAFTDAFSLQFTYKNISNTFAAQSETTVEDSSDSTNTGATFYTDTQVEASIFTLTPAYSWSFNEDLSLVLFVGLNRGFAKATSDYSGTVNDEPVSGAFPDFDGDVYGMQYGLTVNYFISDSWLTSLTYKQDGTDYNLSDEHSYDAESKIIRYGISYVF